MGSKVQMVLFYENLFCKLFENISREDDKPQVEYNSVIYLKIMNK